MKKVVQPSDRAQVAPKPKKPLVSVIVPAFNEAAIIGNNLTRLCEYLQSIEVEYQWELIVVNDGSTDETGDLAEAFAATRDNVHVLHHMYNFRLGQALKYAFTNCKGDYIIVMDVDLSYSPDHIERLLAKIRKTRAKIVIASPYRKGGMVSNVPWLRRIMSILANRFLSLAVTKDKFSDRLTSLTGMVRAYDRQFLSRLSLKAMDYDIMPEILYKAIILRARIVEIPAHLNWGTQKFSGKKRNSSMRILKSIMSSLMSGFVFRPFMFFIIPGLLLFLLAIYPIAWALIHAISFYGSVAGPGGNYTFSAAVSEAFRISPHSFIVGGVSLMIAIQLISLGILALQNKRYFEELFHLNSRGYTGE
jgi:glycosyltransferase involved in cell wall biosynthesis